MFRHGFMHELASVLGKSENTYIMLVDVCEFVQFNEDIGFRNGDAALVESVRRIGTHTTEDMSLMTLAGDEWIVFTNKADFAEVEEIAQQILQYNGECVGCDDMKLPLYLRIAIVKAESVDKRNSVFAARQLDEYMDQLKASTEYLLDLR